MNKMYSLFSICLLLFVIGCSKSEDETVLDCGPQAIISEEQFNNLDNDIPIYIDSLLIDGNCLSVTLGYSGCNDGHDMDLIVSELVAESLPVQISLKFRDNNPQDCESFFTENFVFDLTPLPEFLSSEESARLLFPQDNKEAFWEK